MDAMFQLGENEVFGTNISISEKKNTLLCAGVEKWCQGQALKVVVLKEALNAAVLYTRVETLSPISNEAL